MFVNLTGLLRCVATLVAGVVADRGDNYLAFLSLAEDCGGGNLGVCFALGVGGGGGEDVIRVQHLEDLGAVVVDCWRR